MPLKLEILRIEEGEKTVDAGAASEHKEKTFHVWVQEPKPRKFKINLSKATAGDLNTILNNIGALLLMDVGEMVQQNGHALYLKPDYDIMILTPPPVAETKPEVAPVAETKPEVAPVAETKPEVAPVAETKPEVEVLVPPVADSQGRHNRPPQPTR